MASFKINIRVLCWSFLLAPLAAMPACEESELASSDPNTSDGGGGARSRLRARP